MVNWIMGREELLLERWRELTPDLQQKVFEFVEALKSESDATAPESDYIPQTPLAKKLWEIRQRAIASGMQLLNEAEIEQELAERRGGHRES
ncbi:hypothetical protein [Argonema antarcticum]|uniref:hypothetical protein n=1 Tax=Argonema antarcticum TaxID=2942763 RepID=UPI00201216F4|nr:hypothetical protein [Argonema antarcticum]MCL1473314.1 hypothetical protein [Argonema antarcticum A004/B2]